MLRISLRSLCSFAAIPGFSLFVPIVPFRGYFLFALEDQYLIPFSDLAEDPGCIPVC
jgi:hypothetical protein